MITPDHGKDFGLKMRLRRVNLEKDFPTLAIHFFRDLECNCVVVRVFRRQEAGGSYREAIQRGQWYDEIVDPETWPTDEFIQKLILIA